MHSTRDEHFGDRGAMHMPCNSARSLVPGFLDGELTEAQAAPLRAHLLACPACRETAKDEKNLKGWFFGAEASAVAVPPGFAARVARRAFAGDPGLLTPEAPVSAGTEEGSNLLPFLLQLTAVAAVLLIIFAVAIQTRSLPAGDGLEAGDPPPWERQIDVPGASLDRQAPHDRAADEAEDEEFLDPEARR